MRRKKWKKKDEYKEVKLHYGNGVCNIIQDMDGMYAEYMKRKNLRYTKIKVKIS